MVFRQEWKKLAKFKSEGGSNYTVVLICNTSGQHTHAM
jgi:hypothetical protein